MEGVFYLALESALGAMCPGCYQEERGVQGQGGLCQICVAKWPLTDSGIAYLNKTKVCRAGLYRGSLRQLILHAKATVASPAFHPLYISLRNQVERAQIQSACLTVPPPSWRRRWQGWHLAERIGRKLAKDRGWKFQNLLRRKCARPAQAGLGAYARRRNLVGAFSLAHAVKRKLPDSVWIVDDVWTTGATFFECRDVLEKAGVEVLGALLLAQVDQIEEARPFYSEAS
jgi:predicted amidophosphoribosyltransferase